MTLFREKLVRRQGFLFRLVDVVNELFAMSATIARTIALEKRGAPEAKQAAELADAFCRNSRRVIKQRFKALWNNDDGVKVDVSRGVLDGTYRFMEAMPNKLASDADHE